MREYALSMWKQNLKIRIKDAVLFSYGKCRLYAHRVLYGTHFVKPVELPPETIKCTVTLPPYEVAIPADYQRLSANYGAKNFAVFPEEKAYLYSPPEGLLIREGKYIKLGGRDYLDAGKQGDQRFKQLEQPFLETPDQDENTVILPWGLGHASYGDFLIQVLPKLTRLLESLTPAERTRALICLPEFANIPWAREYLAMLGLTEDRIYTGDKTLKIPAAGSVVVGSGSSGGHGIAHPHDIALMLKVLRPNLPPPTKPERRIYISRKMGRTMENEQDLLGGLLERGFEVVTLEETPLAEQIRTFQEATIVIGPHGAGHANILWSAPGTHLLEVFSPSWMHPCYAILASNCGINYHCLVGETGRAKGRWSHKSRYGIFENPKILPEVFFKKLDQILEI